MNTRINVLVLQGKHQFVTSKQGSPVGAEHLVPSPHCKHVMGELLQTCGYRSEGIGGALGT